MTKRVIVPGIVSLVCAMGLASCSATPGPEAANAARAVLEEQRDLWNAGELEEFVARGYWNSPSLKFLSGGGGHRGYDDALRRYRKKYGDGSVGMGNLAFTEIELVPVGPESFLVRGRWALDYGRDGEQPNGLFSLIMQETSDGWRIVHDHTSSTPRSEQDVGKESGS